MLLSKNCPRGKAFINNVLEDHTNGCHSGFFIDYEGYTENWQISDSAKIKQ